MANPPFNKKAWCTAAELTDDPRWYGYDVPPTSNANYAWILNIVSKLSCNGMANFLLANGALSGDGVELNIRRQLLKNHLVEAIAILPRNMFYSTDISVTLWILAGNRKARTVEQIKQVADNFHNWQREGHENTYRDVPEYCYSATLDEIETKGRSLVPSKYIEFKSRDENIDFDAKMKQLQSEMAELLRQEEESKKDLLNLFTDLGYGIE